ETEIEAKFTNINSQELRQKLQDIGAVLQHPERLMRRKVFDYPDARLYHENAWVRVRDEGDKVTFSFKKLLDRTLHGTKEITVTVSSFDETCNILQAMGFQSKSYQETKRETWTYDGCEITIDTWPWIPEFVEIEAPDEDKIKIMAEKLGFDWKNALHGSVETAYQEHYDVSEEEIDSWPEILFIPVPDWLEIKRKI
ncbi:MAG: class IV adenylate cyclase, partial [Patescibacteria group bacterium]